MKEHIRYMFSLLIALVALLIAVIALVNSKEAKTLSLSEISVEEGASLTVPVFDEEKNCFSFLAIYEVHINNTSGPAVVLNKVAPYREGAGFIVALKNRQIVPADLRQQIFLVNPSLEEIQSNSKLLRDLFKNDLDQNSDLNWRIDSGESKTLRLGVNLFPYDPENQPQVDMVLLSFRFDFDNGTKQIFRRGFPITPVPLLP